VCVKLVADGDEAAVLPGRPQADATNLTYTPPPGIPAF